MRIALGIEYDGNPFSSAGSPQAGNVRTVQTALEDGLSRVADQRVSVVCAGRTDTGVHAVGQVVHFRQQGRNAPTRHGCWAQTAISPKTSVCAGPLPSVTAFTLAIRPSQDVTVISFGREPRALSWTGIVWPGIAKPLDRRANGRCCPSCWLASTTSAHSAHRNAKRRTAIRCIEEIAVRRKRRLQLLSIFAPTLSSTTWCGIVRRFPSC